MNTVKKISVVQQVSDNLVEYILSDDVSIGDKFPTEKELCTMLGVGRGTVREAIRLLQAQGYVEIKPGCGTYVLQKRKIEKEDIENWFNINSCKVMDLIDIRMALEPLAVKLAIQRCDDADIQQLKSIHEQSITATNNKDTIKLAKCDEKFHTSIFEFSNNQALLGICKQINNGLAAFRSKTFLIDRNINNLISAHAAILEAFLKRDIELGESSMRMHLSMVGLDLEASKSI